MTDGVRRVIGVHDFGKDGVTGDVVAMIDAPACKPTTAHDDGLKDDCDACPTITSELSDRDHG